MKLLRDKKTLSKQSSILIPIITGTEFNEKVLERIKDFDKIVLSFAIDSNANVNMMDAGTKMKEAESIIELFKKNLKGRKISNYMQWGDPVLKTKNVALLERVDEILLVNTTRMKKELEQNFNVTVLKV